jgi:hypothetical protein
MWQSAASKANRSSASQQITLKIHYCAYNSLLLDPILSETQPVRALPPVVLWSKGITKC